MAMDESKRWNLEIGLSLCPFGKLSGHGLSSPPIKDNYILLSK
jgi:hypothetical protein